MIKNNLSRFVGLTLWVCAVGLASVLSVQGQTVSGSIVGSVKDSAGGVVPNANVTVTNEATSVAHQTVTSSLGDYNVPFLPPGTIAG